MSYSIDGATGDLVIAGFEKGIADSPYDGLVDLKNININSIPGEASLNFSTKMSSVAGITGSVVSASGNVLTVTNYTTLENNMAIYFTGGSLPPGITANQTYWIGNIGTPLANNFTIYSDFALSSVVTLSGTGTGSFFTYTPNAPTYFAYAITQNSYWCVDAIGQVWTSQRVTTTNSYWVFSGNKVDPFSQGANANGNGLCYYQASNGTGYMFVFRNGGIDYTATATLSWNYGWNPANASINNSSNYLNTPVGTNNPHMALVGQDNVLYYCDSNFLGSWFEKTNQNFTPTNIATYTPAKQALEIPVIDNCNCLAELGINLLVGGQRNVIYPWDRTSTSFAYPILIAENFVQKMLTVNTNTFIFAGNRGRIFITNGTQAQLWMKIPDHISGTVEPYFQWGGVCSVKNQLYFSAQAFTNAGVALSGYGGVWAVDLDTNAIRLTNQLSYGTYLGYATALTPIFQQLETTTVSTPAGTGLYIGWNSGASTYGIDSTISTPYTTAIIVSDLIPTGTLYRKMTPFQFEFKTAYPLAVGESVQILAGSSLADYANNTFTPIGTTVGDNTGTVVSGNFPTTIQSQQWLIVKAILTYTSGTPTYNRITQLRVIGDTVATQIANQPFAQE